MPPLRQKNPSTLCFYNTESQRDKKVGGFFDFFEKFLSMSDITTVNMIRFPSVMYDHSDDKVDHNEYNNVQNQIDEIESVAKQKVYKLTQNEEHHRHHDLDAEFVEAAEIPQLI